MKYGAELGLIPEELFKELQQREVLISSGLKLMSKLTIKPNEISDYFEKIGSSKIEGSETLEKLTKRPEVKLKDMLSLIKPSGNSDLESIINDEKVIEQIEIELKYEGYIKRQYEMVEKMMKLEKINIPLSFNYNEIIQISAEGREKLSKTKPRTIGQASRISGVTPSDISILLVYLKS